jgi:hypothetical protein
MINFLSFGLKAYQGSESQEIGRSSDLKVKDECWENLEKAYNSFKEHWAPPRVMVFVIYQVDSKEFEPCLPGIIRGSNADYLQIIYLNNQLSQMSTWMDISGLIVESSKLYFFKRIIQKSFL